MLHDGENLVQQEELELLHHGIIHAFQVYPSTLLPTEQHFFNRPLEALLKQHKKVKEAWLKQVRTAKERAIRRHMQRLTNRGGVSTKPIEPYLYATMHATMAVYSEINVRYNMVKQHDVDCRSAQSVVGKQC
jgi:hypothetical protein